MKYETYAYRDSWPLVRSLLVLPCRPLPRFHHQRMRTPTQSEQRLTALTTSSAMKQYYVMHLNSTPSEHATFYMLSLKQAISTISRNWNQYQCWLLLYKQFSSVLCTNCGSSPLTLLKCISVSLIELQEENESLITFYNLITNFVCFKYLKNTTAIFSMKI